MKHLMIDLETTGKTTGCGILSIGAVVFYEDGPGLGEEFHITINRKSCRELGLEEDKETIKWWSEQAGEARALLHYCETEGEAVTEALQKFSDWVRSIVKPGEDIKDLQVWSNGASFDLPIIEHVYAMVNISPAWKFWGHRCYRTLKNLHPHIKLKRLGLHHNALADAISQADHAVRLLAYQKASWLKRRFGSWN